MNQSISNNYTNLNHMRILRMRDVVDMCGLSKSHIHSLISEEKFPRGVLLVPGGVAKGWLEYEIVAWIEQRVEERDQENANG